MSSKDQTLPPQHQQQEPGIESQMHPKPQEVAPREPYGKRFTGKTFVVTGGDSGIGRSIALEAAREGANVAILYLSEDGDADTTIQKMEQSGAQCLKIKGDVGDPSFAQRAIDRTLERFSSIDVLVNDAGEQHPQDDVTKISEDQLERTFRTNIFGYFHMVQAARPHLKPGSAIVNIASVTAYKGSPELLDYSATKGAIVAFTRSLSMSLAQQNIRVNAIAPGPIWTPLIPSTFPADKVATFGSDVPMGRPDSPTKSPRARSSLQATTHRTSPDKRCTSTAERSSTASDLRDARSPRRRRLEPAALASHLRWDVRRLSSRRCRLRSARRFHNRLRAVSPPPLPPWFHP